MSSVTDLHEEEDDACGAVIDERLALDQDLQLLRRATLVARSLTRAVSSPD